jgi:hypothetical protein
MTDLKEPVVVIWGMGSYRSKFAHAYASKEAYERGECICGRKVMPVIKFDHWDLNEKLAEEHTCPECQNRLKFFQYR